MSGSGRKPLSIIEIAKRNLSHKKIRTAIMTAFVFILASSIFVSTILVDSMTAGINKTVDRIGADVIVVPQESEDSIRSSLFLGNCCTVYTDSSYFDVIKDVEGIEIASPQLYLASLEAECCGIATQIIAFDPETDFIIKPWLDDIKYPKLGYGEVIAGCEITTEVGDYIKFFDKEFKLVGKLEQTNTSYDYCVFMDNDTAKIILNTDTMQMIVDYADPDAVMSAVMIRVKDGYDSAAIARYITYKLKIPMKAYTANGMFAVLTDNLAQITGFSNILNILLFITAVLALICIFTITINERRHEFGVLISLGAKSSQIVEMVILEAVFIGLLGGVISLAFMGAIVLIFHTALAELLKVPYIVSDVSVILPLIAKCLIISIITAVLASLYSAIRIGRAEPYTLIKEDE